MTFTQILYPNASPWLCGEGFILWQGCYRQGEAFADKNPGFPNKPWRKCFTPTKSRILPSKIPSTA